MNATGPAPQLTVCDGALLRSVMGCFATGVAIVTTRGQDETAEGMTVNSLTSVSLDPPLLLVCLTRKTRTAAALMHRGAFAVNVLGADQGSLSDRFARPGDDHFGGVAVHQTELGVPLLQGAMAHLLCKVEAVHDGGDHHIAVGRVEAAHVNVRRPLIFYRGRYDTLTGHGQEAALHWYW